MPDITNRYPIIAPIFIKLVKDNLVIGHHVVAACWSCACNLINMRFRISPDRVVDKKVKTVKKCRPIQFQQLKFFYLVSPFMKYWHIYLKMDFGVKQE